MGALAWFEARDEDSVGICRVTQMGLLRLLTNPNVLSSGVYPVQRAWNISNELIAGGRVFFEYEPPNLEPVWTAMMMHPAAGHTLISPHSPDSTITKW
jgi:hypothetical protein